MNSKDSLYSEPIPDVADFTFDEKVAAVFPDMIKRSVPGYSTVIAMTGVLAGQYAKADSHCYDLGCSLGESSYAMMREIKQPGCKVVGVDNSPEMIAKCEQIFKQQSLDVDYQLICDDVLNIELNSASVVVLNYTLQFIEPAKRDEFIKRIYDSLLPGGILLLSEKIQHEDDVENQHLIDMHHQFKKANGYSDLEISQKRTALENVLLPETIATHNQRLKSAGFKNAELWFQCFNFISLIARKAA